MKSVTFHQSKPQRLQLWMQIVKNDSGDGDEESDDDDKIVLHNKNYQKSSIFDDDDNNDSEQQNAANTKTSAEVIAGTNMNDTPTADGEISKDTTADPIKSDVTEKKRKSSKDLKETTPPKRGQGN